MMVNEICMKMLIELYDFNKKYAGKEFKNYKVDKININKLRLLTENFNEHGAKIVEFIDEDMMKKKVKEVDVPCVGDIIIKINEKEIYTEDQIEKIIKHAKTIGTDIILVYIKGVNYRSIDEAIKTEYDVPNVNYKEDTYNFLGENYNSLSVFQNNINKIDDVGIHKEINDAKQIIYNIIQKKKYENEILNNL